MVLSPFTMTKHSFGSPIKSSGMPYVFPVCPSSWWTPADLNAFFQDFILLEPDAYALKGVLFCPFTNFILGLCVVASVGPTVSPEASSNFPVDCCPQLLVRLKATIAAEALCWVAVCKQTGSDHPAHKGSRSHWASQTLCQTADLDLDNDDFGRNLDQNPGRKSLAGQQEVQMKAVALADSFIQLPCVPEAVVSKPPPSAWVTPSLMPCHPPGPSACLLSLSWLL